MKRETKTKPLTSTSEVVIIAVVNSEFLPMHRTPVHAEGMHQLFAIASLKQPGINIGDVPVDIYATGYWP